METVLYEVVDHVALLTLNRPAQKNALDGVMRRELAEVVAAIQRDETVRALVITGAGGAFCSGGDIRGMQGGTADEARSRMVDLHNWFEPLVNLDRPVIAAVDGVAYGAGFSLALAADLVLATPRARFCVSFLRVGLIPDLALLYTLPRVVGRQRAKELVFSTRELGADEAMRLGIVVEVHPVERLAARAIELARSMTAASPVALGMAKRALNAATENDLRTMLELEATGQALARSTEHHRTAVARFLNKEPPMFRWPPAQS